MSLIAFTPYPHQTAGIDWILSHPYSALFWGMGSGKTITTLTALDILLHDYMEKGPVLIIAPKRVAENTWSGESSKWQHISHLRVSKVMGDLKHRTEALQTPADLYVINRENVSWLVEYLGSKWFFPIVVIDELSSFKSAQAKRWKDLKRVRGKIDRVIGLTGTPRPNGIEDLWPEIYLLDGGQRLGRTLSVFRQNYLKPDKMSGHIVYSYKPLPGAEEQVYEKISDICMSIRKEDVLTLPGQQFIDIDVTLPDTVLRQYRKFEREQVLEVLDAENNIIAGNAASLTNKLLQFANGAIYDEDGGVHELHDAKLDALEELIEEAGGDTVLIFYSYKHDLQRIQKRIPCRVLDTEADMKDWNLGRIPVAVAHPASIGHGLNLQYGGHICIWFGLTWSLELYQQANERLNRPGQQSVCRIYHLIAKGTHDSRVLKALQRKEVGQTAAIEALRLEIINAIK